MKKVLYFTILLVICSCSKDESNEQNNNNQQQEKPSIVGVWENNGKFVSFNNENFCCAYFDNEYIDCGSYIQTGNMITTNNTYYAKQTKYNIVEITSNSITLQIEYVPIHGDTTTKTMTFSKNNSIMPAVKDHSLVGKSHTSLVWFGGSSTYSTWSFDTYNTGSHSLSSGSASKYPLKVFYIFLDNKIYYQTFRTTEQMPTIGGWIPSIEVTQRTIQFKSDGSISL